MKLTSEQKARLELALMGWVQPCNEEEVDLVAVTKYILSAVNGVYNLTEEQMDAKAKEAVENIHKYDEEDSKNTVRFISVKTAPVLGDDVQITYIIDTGDEYSPCNFTDPRQLVKDHERQLGIAYYWFSYVYNVGVAEFSTLGDTFYRMNTSNHRVYRVS